jgi:hypothetical protein
LLNDVEDHVLLMSDRGGRYCQGESVMYSPFWMPLCLGSLMARW